MAESKSQLPINLSTPVLRVSILGLFRRHMKLQSNLHVRTEKLPYHSSNVWRMEYFSIT